MLNFNRNHCATSKTTAIALNSTDSQRIYRLMNQVFEGVELASTQLWLLCEAVGGQNIGKISGALEKMNHQLAGQFDSLPVTGIKCLIGGWEVGAISLRKKNEIQIITGKLDSSTDNHHVLRHELCHHYLRWRLNKELTGTESEEFFVQFLTRWELDKDLLQNSKNYLEKAANFYQSKNWNLMNCALQELQCSV